MGEADAKRRWFPATPGRLIVGLLAAECLLWLSDRLGCPAWHKGYAVLTALAAVVVVLAALVLWWAASFVVHWRFQFSIRSLLALVLAAALPLSWLRVDMEKARSQRNALSEITAMGGYFDYDFDFEGVKPPGPDWLRELVGIDFIADVAHVQLGTVDDAWLQRLKGLSKLQSLLLDCEQITDAGLERLKCLTKLDSLSLENTQVTDRGLEQLGKMKQLRSLDLTGTKATDAGIDRLQKSLRDCAIKQWEGVALINAGDWTALQNVSNLLKTKGIDLQYGGSIVYGIQVPQRRAEEATRLLRADAKKKGYWIKLETY